MQSNVAMMENSEFEEKVNIDDLVLPSKLIDLAEIEIDDIKQEPIEEEKKPDIFESDHDVAVGKKIQIQMEENILKLYEELDKEKSENSTMDFSLKRSLKIRQFVKEAFEDKPNERVCFLCQENEIDIGHETIFCPKQFCKKCRRSGHFAMNCEIFCNDFVIKDEQSVKIEKIDETKTEYSVDSLPCKVETKMENLIKIENQNHGEFSKSEEEALMYCESMSFQNTKKRKVDSELSLEEAQQKVIKKLTNDLVNLTNSKRKMETELNDKVQGKEYELLKMEEKFELLLKEYRSEAVNFGEKLKSLSEKGQPGHILPNATPSVPSSMSSGNSSVMLKIPPLMPAGMTGVGQRMPLQQAIILRPGQPTSIVTLPGGQQIRQQVNTQPVLVNSAMPSAGGHPIPGPVLSTQTSGGGRNVIINQSGYQISMPLHAVQSLQAGKFSFFGVYFAENCKLISIQFIFTLQVKEYLLDRLVIFLSKQRRGNTKLSKLPPGRLPPRGFLSARRSQFPILCLVPPQAHRHPKQLHLSLQPKMLGV